MTPKQGRGASVGAGLKECPRHVAPARRDRVVALCTLTVRPRRAPAVPAPVNPSSSLRARRVVATRGLPNHVRVRKRNVA